MVPPKLRQEGSQAAYLLLQFLQLPDVLLQAKQLLLDILHLCWAQGATSWDPIPFLGRPCSTVFLHGTQQLLQGMHFLEGHGSELALTAGSAEGQEVAEESLSPGICGWDLSATVAILGAIERGLSGAAWTRSGLGTRSRGRDLQAAGSLRDEGAPAVATSRVMAEVSRSTGRSIVLPSGVGVSVRL